MRYKEELIEIVCFVIAVLLATDSVLHTFPDSRQYIGMVNMFLGIGRPVELTSPFMFRILVPALSLPFALVVEAELALCIVELLFFGVWAVYVYRIARDFTTDWKAPFLVTIAVLMTPITFLYAGAALTDSAALAFIAMIIYYSNQIIVDEERITKHIGLLFLLGLLAKEIVIFVLLYQLLSNPRNCKMILKYATPGIAVWLVVRSMIGNALYQPLAWHEAQPWVISNTIQTLGPIALVSLLLIVAWIRYDEVVPDALWLALFAFVAFVPIWYLGAFHAYFGCRFAWPLQLVFIPAAATGLGSSIDALERRIGNTQVWHRLRILTK